MLLELNDWPAGLKLNYELGKFFCDAFLWFLALWESGMFLAVIDLTAVDSRVSSDWDAAPPTYRHQPHCHFWLLWPDVSTRSTFRPSLAHHFTCTRLLSWRDCPLFLAYFSVVYFVQHISR